ncbi:hypothetical protein Q5H92_11070 [Hymenobacter sp. M29]|uniref:DUF2569 domain-containing protein n=1 Tax=Hymenobacter mellowenesis TaxID=3063995 RepID=A0ABT9AAN4_9BACT|nr:hypothetical protein [Hymenobacter sp. M29]MDO7846900.1 hypothetical protein [Hymenobacter sp. M29]
MKPEVTFYPTPLSLRLWLFTNLLAGLGWFAWYACKGHVDLWTEGVIIPIVITLVSLLASVLAIPLGAWLFAMIMPQPLDKRVFYSVCAILLLWLQAVLLVALTVPGAFQDLTGLLVLTSPQLVAAFVATGVVYRHWLFRAEELGEEYDD